MSRKLESVGFLIALGELFYGFNIVKCCRGLIAFGERAGCKVHLF